MDLHPRISIFLLQRPEFNPQFRHLPLRCCTLAQLPALPWLNLNQPSTGRCPFRLRALTRNMPRTRATGQPGIHRGVSAHGHSEALSLPTKLRRGPFIFYDRVLCLGLLPISQYHVSVLGSSPQDLVSFCTLLPCFGRSSCGIMPHAVRS